jgi:hypothetical protein
MDLGVILVRPVAEVEPESVDARDKQRLQHLGRGACRSDGGDDLGSAMTTHGSIGHFGRPHVIRMIRTLLTLASVGPADEVTNAVEESKKGVVTRAYTLASSPAVSSVPLMLSPATAFPEVFVKHLLLSRSPKVIRLRDATTFRRSVYGIGIEFSLLLIFFRRP